MEAGSDMRMRNYHIKQGISRGMRAMKTESEKDSNRAAAKDKEPFCIFFMLTCSSRRASAVDLGCKLESDHGNTEIICKLEDKSSQFVRSRAD